MTIKTDHINLNREEDPAHWYLFALEHKNTFLFLYDYVLNFQKRMEGMNIDTLPPQPGITPINTIYFTAIELYLKAFLLIKVDSVNVKTLRSKNWSHNLEKLRKRCAEIDNEFNNNELVWIIGILEAMFKTHWALLKYPSSFAPAKEQNYMSDPNNKRQPPLFGSKTMTPPLEFLDAKVKDLVYIED